MLAALVVACLNVYFASVRRGGADEEVWGAGGARSQDTKEVPLFSANPSSSSSSWQMLLSSDPPYTDFAPKLDVIWSRGWYNAQWPPPEGVPIGYYNEKGRETVQSPKQTIASMFSQPERLCQHSGADRTNYVWVRTADLRHFAGAVQSLPASCNMSLISSDGDESVSSGDRTARTLLRHVHRWYAQNMVERGHHHPQLIPIPIGMNFHTGFPGSPHTVDTVQQMDLIRKDMAEGFRERPRAVLLDYYGGTHPSRRETVETLSRCPGGMEQSPRRGQLETWRDYASHQFGIAPRGNGPDTHRFWEYLLYGTVPVVRSGPLDPLYLDAHVPVVIVDEWSEVCEWLEDSDKYERLVSRYEGWIRNAHLWLRPGIWVPRNQAIMDELCRLSPGCEETYKEKGRFHPTTKS
jgi:hypothetical protein